MPEALESLVERSMVVEAVFAARYLRLACSPAGLAIEFVPRPVL